ncbi:MAG: DUF4383 domain-containing protein [Candidatus Dormibacteria bacterium]
MSDMNKLFAGIAGAVFTVLGIAGFVAAGSGTATVLGIEVNSFHNGLHLALGLVGLYAYRSGLGRDYARAMGVFAAVLVVSAFTVPAFFGLMKVSGYDLWLNALTAIAGLYVGWGASRLQHSH